MRTLRCWFPLLLTSSLMACATGVMHQPVASLRTAESPAPAMQQFGSIRLMTVPNVPTNYVAEDSAVRIVWAQHETYMGLKVTNKTRAAIKILWDNAAMVGRRGNSGRIMPSGVRFLTRDESHPPAVVPPGAFWIGSVTPTDNVILKGSDWSINPLFDPRLAPGDMRILLPLEIDGHEYDYQFTFAVAPAARRR